MEQIYKYEDLLLYEDIIRNTFDFDTIHLTIPELIDLKATIEHIIYLRGEL
jgi:hypothetical protein